MKKSVVLPLNLSFHAQAQPILDIFLICRLVN